MPRAFPCRRLLAIGVAAIAVPTLAAGPPTGPLQVTSRILVERRVAAADGTTRIVATANGRHAPGDRLVVELAYRNTGQRPIADLVLADPVPAALVYRAPAEGSPPPELSVDGIRFAPLDDLVVPLSGGERHPLVPRGAPVTRALPLDQGMTLMTHRRILLLAGVAAIATAGSAAAQSTTGTVAGTVVSNTAQASYTVNGTAQTTASNASTFVVDRKVNLTVVTAQASNTQVNLGQTGAIATFRVTNNTNGIQDFLLAATQVVPAGILTGTNNFALTNLKIYVDANANGVYDPGVDTASFVDELAPDASATVFVVGDVPNQQNADRAFVGLDVTTATGGAAGTAGTALVPTDLNVVDQNNVVDVVFADDDNDGALGFDTARNGQGWAYAAYQVGVHNVSLSVVKSSTVLSDGVSTVNPKALPGAVVQYCLTVSNATLLTPATGVTLSDVIPTNTSYVPGSITVGGIGGAGVCLVNGVAVADDGSTTAPYTGGYNATTKTVSATIPLLAGGTSLAASFRVTVR